MLKSLLVSTSDGVFTLSKVRPQVITRCTPSISLLVQYRRCTPSISLVVQYRDRKFSLIFPMLVKHYHVIVRPTLDIRHVKINENSSMAATTGVFCKSLTKRLKYGRALRKQFTSKETKVANL